MSTVNEDALRLLLAPSGESPLVGAEIGIVEPEGITYLISPHASVRYVYAVGGKIVSALQVMVSDKKGVATNVYTDPAFRRQGLARELAARARLDFANLEFSGERSPDGQAWVQSLQSQSTRKLGAIFQRMVTEAPNELAAVLFNWNESELDEDKTGIVRHPGRDARYSRGADGGKDRVKISDLVAWLKSDAPFDSKTYGPRIDPEWRYQVTRLRHLAGMKAETFYEALLGSGMARLPDGHSRNYTLADGVMLPTLERAGVRISMSSGTELYEENGRVMAGIGEQSTWTINALLVDVGRRRQGLATKAMSEITALADLFGVTLHLEVTPIDDKPLSREQLVAFYGKFGFAGDRVQRRAPAEAEFQSTDERERGAS